MIKRPFKKRARPPIAWIDTFEIGLGSSAVVSFAAIFFAIIAFSLQENLGPALFIAHCLVLFVTGSGLSEDILHPEPFPEKNFEDGYIIGAALSIILVTAAQYALHAYFALQLAQAVGTL